VTPVPVSAPKKEPAVQKPSTNSTNAGMWPALRKTSTPAPATLGDPNHSIPATVDPLQDAIPAEAPVHYEHSDASDTGMS
jgi:hypothetical protein